MFRKYLTLPHQNQVDLTNKKNNQGVSEFKKMLAALVHWVKLAKLPKLF